ncbi:MAG TPA: NCS2 family permease [Sumerlaeia bacterium]|nr:NCS2 family permease [Sumerlaeia bacterium]
MSAFDRYFDLKARGTTAATELRGAVATFLTMAYILVANAGILAAAGVPRESVIACTALAAGICCVLMGLIANFPLALASGMGLNAVLAFEVVKVAGSWQTAMGLVVLDGIVVLALVICGLREAVMESIPRDLRLATGAGIGFFIAFIGAVNARMVIVPGGTVAVLSGNPDAVLPPVTYGSLSNPDTAIAVLGLLVTAFLMARRVKGAIVLGILISTVAALIVGVAKIPETISAPSFEVLFQADVTNALRGVFGGNLLPLLFAFLMVDFFDTLGTATAVAEQAGLRDEKGKILGLRRILLVDSASASIGGFCGVSSVTSYIESAAGVAEGARTGLHTVIVGVFFLLAVFLAPVAAIVPFAATAPALILVGFLMCAQIVKIDFKKLDTAIPAFVTLVTLPITYSICHGIGYGFITYTAIKVLSLKFREVHPLMYGIAAAFAAYFIWGAA